MPHFGSAAHGGGLCPGRGSFSAPTERTINLEYEGKPVRIRVPLSFEFEVDDVLVLRKEGDGYTLTNPHGDILPVTFAE